MSLPKPTEPSRLTEVIMSQPAKARRFYVITGGTYVHIAPHFSLCAPAHGTVGEAIGRELKRLFVPEGGREFGRVAVRILRTTMAGGRAEQSTEIKELYRAAGIKFLETNQDLAKLLDHLVTLPETVGIVLAAAVCDWQPYLLSDAPKELDEAAKRFDDFVLDVNHSEHPAAGSFGVRSDEVVQIENAYAESDLCCSKKMLRLQTSTGNKLLALRPADKLIHRIRRTRKDIFLVGFKATTGMDEQEQYLAGLGLLKGASCNLVLANDVHEHLNMVITPEEAKYHVTKNRDEAIKGLCEMIVLRSGLTFTRSTVVDGPPVPWNAPTIPHNLRTVVNHCIARGAYKPFQGKTVGHFATRGPQDGVIYTSRRKSNFNNLENDGLLHVEVVGDDEVISYGGKPSVGGQSQRIIFSQHPDVDCIIHFHCPLREAYRNDLVPRRSQRAVECGSHECGRNTSEGLAEVWPGIKAVMLDEHGPNICFSAHHDPAHVIEFIEAYWRLEEKTGGPVEI
jgi:hypothetical protein